MADVTEVEYEQLLEMISAFQWLPDENCLRVALDRERDNGPGNPLFGCLHHYAAAIKRMTDRGELNGQNIHLFLVKLAARYELVQRIDAQSIMTKVNRLVEVVGVDVELIGVGNAYATAFVLLVRSRIPFEWNRFCEYVDRRSWRVEISNQDAQSSRETLSADEYKEWGSDELINDSELHAAPEKAMVGGLAQAFEHPDFAAYADSVLNECRDQHYQPEDVTKLESATSKQVDRPQFKRFWGR